MLGTRRRSVDPSIDVRPERPCWPRLAASRREEAMWPSGMRAAAAFTFDFDAEEVWIGEDPRNADRPGVLSQGTYGAKVAVPLILQLLQRHDIRATFFV